MSQSITLDAKGLHTYASDISGVPVGSFSVAQNVNINRAGIIECRRGFDFLAFGLPLSSDRPKKLVFWNDKIFCHYGPTFAMYDEALGFVSRGSLTGPANATSVRTIASQNKNLYVTSDAGLKKTDAITSSLYAAGIPKAVTADLALAGAGTAVDPTKYVIYQYALGRKDGNNNLQIGGVSGSFTIQNTAGSTQDVNVTCYLPSGLDTSYFVQLYRTAGGTSADVAGALDPQLVSEVQLQAANVAAGYVVIKDITPDAQRGATIYTANSQQGIANDNLQPPLARDIAEFKGCMFYADVQGKHTLMFSLLGVSSTGIAVGNTVTISNASTTEVYTGTVATENSATKQFIVTTGLSTTQNIDATVKSLIKIINLASTLVYAYAIPTSDASPFPGHGYLEARSFNTAAFTVTSSAPATAFSPAFVSPANSANTSTADISRNGLAFSKPGQPEAVPLANYLKVGAADDPIKRIIALREGLFIFKERGGCYVLRGEGKTSFAVNLLDSTAKLVAPESLAIVNNFAYGLFEGGICEVSDTGVSIISTPIKDQLLNLFGSALSVLKSLTFGVGSDVDGKYILSIPSLSVDTYTNKQLVYDTFGRTFCTWNLGLTCGGINPTDSRMYLGQGASNFIQRERRAFDYTDFADYQATCTISSYSGTTVTIDGTLNMTAGDILYQGSNAFAYIEAVDSGLGQVTVDSQQSWTTGTATVTHMKAIDCKVQWNPDSGGNAAGLKQYYECALITRQAFQKSATLVFSSDLNASEAAIAIVSSSGNGAWGQFAFGDEVFGGEQAKAPKRVGIPRGQARCSQLSVRFETRVAYNDFQVTGLSLSFNPTSTRTTR